MQRIFGSTAAGIIIILLLLLVLFLVAVTYRLNARMADLTKKYRSLSRKETAAAAVDPLKEAGLAPDVNADAESPQTSPVSSSPRSRRAGTIDLDKLANRAGEQRQQIRSLRNQYDQTLSKYSIVKYDAFEDVGGKLSFALAMLDNENSGFVLDAIHSRDNCFLYLKEIVKGESYIMLSEEETEALRQAAASRDQDIDGI